MFLEIVSSVGLILLTVVAVAKLFRSQIYNVMIVHLTSQWYEEVLTLIGKNSKVLDVGIGTGQALIRNKSVIIQKGLTVDGVDYDLDYIKECEINIRKESLDKYISVYHKSILDYQGGPYDVIYFSASLMILPDPIHALNHVKKMLAPSGKIYVTQTIETNKSFLIEFVKPLLKYISTIDFGHVTYEDDLITAFRKANLQVQLNKPISGTSMLDARSYRLFVLQCIK